MKQINQEELIIMKNVLLLAELNEKSLQSERNLLNKWFQDSIKTYIFESTASHLIAKYLKLDTSAEVKSFIQKQTSINKPKYMGIIEQYFIYIKKYNQQDPFLNGLQQIISNPVEFTQEDNLESYKNQKIIRKQFVCLLIFKYFQLFGQYEIPSFYELWNICFPQKIQKKKKLSKYDKKVDKKTLEKVIKNEDKLNYSSLQSSTFLTNSASHSLLSFTNQSNIYYQQESNSFLPTQKIEYIDQSNLQQSQTFQINNEEAFYPQKQQINNRIFEEDSYEQEPMSDYLNYYYNQQTPYQNEVKLCNQKITYNNHSEPFECIDS